MEDEVLTAFDLLLSELDSEKERIADEIKKAILKDDFEDEKRLRGKIRLIEDFTKDVKRLREKWISMSSEDFEESFGPLQEDEREKAEELPSIFRVLSSSDDKLKSSERRRRRDLNLGVSRQEYKMVILETLMELGGKGRAGNVLDRVFEKLRDKMTEDDLERLPSGEARWRKNARWAEYFMVREGLLNPNSPRGIWEVTKEGRRYWERGRNHDFSRQR